MKAFILRPFGIKDAIDFDRVSRELVVPALKRLDIAADASDTLSAGGDELADELQRLLTADLVVADVSVSIPRVFYELGARQALRARGTIVIRASTSREQLPFFDLLLLTRFFTYDPYDPGAALEALVDAVRGTLASDQRDSPLFQLLPDLVEQRAANFQVLPADFVEEVERAVRERRAGDLALLAAETSGAGWEIEGLRRVGHAQRTIGAWHGARATWESIQRADPDDADANAMLGHIYFRLRDFARSGEALRRVLESPTAHREQRAEARTLIAAGGKRRWVEDWGAAPPGDRRERALRSAWLMESCESYVVAYQEDLNGWYCGLNAMMMLTIVLDLAGALPEVWGDRFDSDADAKLRLDALAQQLAGVTAATDLVLGSASGRSASTDPWLSVAIADFALLTARRSGRVASLYQKAVTAFGGSGFWIDSIREHLQVYQDLDVLSENVRAALEIIDAAGQPASPPPTRSARTVLFAGHRVDLPGQSPPRFPLFGERVAGDSIRAALRGELDAGPVSLGIAGGSDGGDILFHEACRALDIPTQVYLAVPSNAYVQAGVAPEWADRFYRLVDQSPPRVLSPSLNVPLWLMRAGGYESIWEREARWKLFNALEADRTTLLALWDGEESTVARVVEEARKKGARVVILDTKRLFNLL